MASRTRATEEDRKRMRRALARWEELFGDTRVAAITRAQVKQFKDKLFQVPNRPPYKLRAALRAIPGGRPPPRDTDGGTRYPEIEERPRPRRFSIRSKGCTSPYSFPLGGQMYLRTILVLTVSILIAQGAAAADMLSDAGLDRVVAGFTTTDGQQVYYRTGGPIFGLSKPAAKPRYAYCCSSSHPNLSGSVSSAPAADRMTSGFSAELIRELPRTLTTDAPPSSVSLLPGAGLAPVH